MPEKLLLDVRTLEHPQPFEEVLQGLNKLSAGSYLHMLHRRTPYPLLQILNENGYDYKILKPVKAEFEVLIWKTDDLPTARYCQRQ